MFRHLTRNKNWNILLTGALFSIFCAPVFLYALPEVENVAEGTVSIEQPDAVTLNITASDKAIINYKQFNIAENETVRFIQPDSVSAALNRDLSGAISQILGRLFANGSIILVNTAGINIGANADINVASIIASTLNISDADFLSGNYKFFKSGENAFILNKGKIVINGGYVGMLSGAVENQGTIIANLGTVALASGEEMTLALDDLNQISVVIDKGVQSEVLGFDSGVKNSGTIIANGGKVVLTAKVLNKVFDYAVNNTGVIEAGSLVERNGVVELIGEGAPVLNVGQIIASGLPGLGVDGGRISIEAAAIMQKGLISANSIEGGTAGQVDIVSQTSTVLDSGSTTEARAVGLAGNGGRVTVNSTGGNTVVNKNAVIDVSAGAISGDAGFIEVSAFDQLGFYGILNGRAPPGYKKATIFFDPYSLSGGDIIVASSIIEVGDVTIIATGNLTINANIITTNGNIILTADSDSSGAGDFHQNFGIIKTIGSGNITISGHNVTVRNVVSAANLTVNATQLLTIASTSLQRDTFTITAVSLGITSDLTDFPILVKLDGSYNYTHTNLYFEDSLGNLLSYDIEKWGASEAWIWVKLPILSYSSDTIFYMYHDTGILSSPTSNNPTDVWSAGYSAVQQLSGDYNDATINGYNGINHGTALVAGKVADAAGFDGSGDYIDLGNALNLTSPITVSAWVNIASVGVDMQVVSKGYDGTNTQWEIKTSTLDGKVSFRKWTSGGAVGAESTSFLGTGTWIYLTGVYDGTWHIYWNGIEEKAVTAGAPISMDKKLYIGAVDINGTPGQFWNGFIDQVEISDVVRSPDWINASYLTQNIPITSGATTAVTGGLSAAGTVELTAGSAIVDNNPGTDVTATSAIFHATSGIDLDTHVTNLMAENTGTTGNIEIDNIGDLNILGMQNLAPDGTIEINAASSILVRYSIEAAGNIFLTADDNIYLSYFADISAPGKTITLTATNGKITLKNLETGLVGYWKLDGNADDSSATGNNGTGYGGVGYGSGPYGHGQALTLDGADDLIEVLNNLSLNITGAITIEGWINLDSFAQQATIAGKWRDISGTNLRGYLLTVATNGVPRFYISTTGADYPNAAGSALSTGTWYHLVGTYDGAVIKLYIDGVLNAQTAQTGAIYTNTESLLIGANDGWGGSNRKFTDGLVDDVRIYNRVLSDIEIYAHLVVTPGTGVIRGGSLILNAATGIGSDEALQTVVSALQATNSAENNINITNNGDLIATSVVNNAPSGEINITVNSNLTVGSISASKVTLNANNGAIIDGNAGATNITATNLILNAVNGIGMGNALETIVEDILATATNGNIQIDNNTDTNANASATTGTGNILFSQSGAGSLTIKASSSGGDVGITVKGSGNLIVDTISALNTVNLVVYNGSIIDGNDATGPPAHYDITALNLILSAKTGIGDNGITDNPLETHVSNLLAINSYSGDINLDNTGDLTIYGLFNDGGNINLTNHSDLFIRYSVISKGNITLESDHNIYLNYIADITTPTTATIILTATNGEIAYANLGGGVSDLLGYWAFDDNADDSSGNNHDGSLIGTGTSYSGGQFGDALNFGGSAYVDIGYKFNFGSGPFTIALWYKGTQIQDYIGLAGATPGSGAGYTIENHNGHLRSWVNNNTDDGILNIADGNWHQLIMVRYGPTGSLYVDGIGDNINFDTLATSVDTAINFCIGGWGINGYLTKGAIDEVRVYGAALTPIDIYAQSQIPAGTGLISGGNLILSAKDDIGSSADPIRTAVATLTAKSSDGDIWINETNAITLEEVIVNSSVINITADDTIDAIKVVNKGGEEGDDITLISYNGDINVGYIRAKDDGDVNLFALLGGIYDLDNGSDTDIIANVLTMQAQDAIGAVSITDLSDIIDLSSYTGMLDTRSDVINAWVTDGSIFINEANGVILNDIKASSSIIGIVTNGNTTINSMVAASVDNIAAALVLNLNGKLTANYVRARSDSDLALVILASEGKIIANDVRARSNDYLALTALLALNGDIQAIDVRAKGDEFAGVLIGSLRGDIYADYVKAKADLSAILLANGGEKIILGDLQADIIAALALNGSIKDDGDVTAEYLGLIAKYDIGTKSKPIQTNVRYLTAYSFDTGNIWINEKNNIQLGFDIPYFDDIDLTDVFGFDLQSLALSYLGMPLPALLTDLPVVANNGSVHVTAGNNIKVYYVEASDTVKLKSINGVIRDVNDNSERLEDISADKLYLEAAGNIGHKNNRLDIDVNSLWAESSTGDIYIKETNDIDLRDVVVHSSVIDIISGSDMTAHNVVNNGGGNDDDIILTTLSNDIEVDTIKATGAGDVVLNAAGDIKNEVDGCLITADDLEMYAGDNIGRDGRRIFTRVNDLWAIAHGDVYIDESNGVNLWDIQALGSTVDIITGGTTHAYNVYAYGDGAADDAIINLTVTTGDLIIEDNAGTNSNILAKQVSDGLASVNLTTNNGDISITYGHIEARVEGLGTGNTATVTLSAAGAINILGTSGGITTTVEALVYGDGDALVKMDAGTGISVTDDTVLASVGGDGTARIYFDAGNNIRLINSKVKAESTNGISNVTFDAGNNIILENNSVVRANSNNGVLARIYFDAGKNIELTDSKVIAKDSPISGGLARIRFEAGNNISLITSEVRARGINGSSWISFYAYNKIHLVESLVRAFSQDAPSMIGGAYIGFTTSAGNIVLDDSKVRAVDSAAAGRSARVNFSAGDSIRIINDSLVKARNLSDDESSVNLLAANNVNINHSSVIAEVGGSGNAAVNMTSVAGIIDITNSDIWAKVDGTTGINSATVDMDAGDNITIDPSTILAFVVNGTADISLTSGGDIDIIDTTVASRVRENGDATINMDADGDIDITTNTAGFETLVVAGYDNLSSLLSPISASISMTAGDDIAIDMLSEVSAQSNYDDVLISISADGAIDARGLILADATSYPNNGIARVNMTANGDIYAGNVRAEGDGAFVIEEDVANLDPTLADQYTYGGKVSIFSNNGDITLDDIIADEVLVEAKGLDGSGSIIDTGDVVANYLRLLALNNIGTAANPIRTQVYILAAYSSGAGDIYIFQNVNKQLDLGLYLERYNAVHALINVVGRSVAANNGIIHILSNGDIVVNSVVAPRGGILLMSLKSIYAGHGWCPAYTGVLPATNVMDGWSALGGPNGFYAVMSDPVSLPVGPNLIAGGYSFLAAPYGTIGVGSTGVLPADAYNPLYVNVQLISGAKSAFPFDFDPFTSGNQDPPAVLSLFIGGVVTSTTLPIYTDGVHGDLGISGALKGIVRPGVFANPGYLDVPMAPLLIGGLVLSSQMTDLGLTSSFQTPFFDIVIPPGYVFHDDNATACAYPLTGYLAAVNSTTATTYLFTNQIWPPIGPGSPTAYLLVLQWLPPILEHMLGARGVEVSRIDLMTSDILARSTFYYHPLTSYDMSAFGKFVLEEGAYDFIDGNLSLGEGNDWLNSLISQDEEAKKKKKGTQ